MIFGQMAGGKGIQPFKTVKDYDNWLKRVDDYMVWCDTAMANIRKGIELGYVLPKSLIVKVIPQMEKFANTSVENNIFFSPVKNIPRSFADEEKVRITNEYRNICPQEGKHLEYWQLLIVLIINT